MDTRTLNSNIYDDALKEYHGDASCYCQARTEPGYETQYKKNDYSRGNAYFRSGGNSSRGGDLASQSFRSSPRIAQRVVKTPPRVRFSGLKEFGTNESDSGHPKQPGETLNKTIGGVIMQCHKCKSRYHLFLKCLEGGRSEKVNYISMMMDMAEDFSDRDPGELLAECIGDFLYDDLDHNIVADIENNANDTSWVNLVDKHNDDTGDLYDGVCIETRCRFTVCGLRQYNAFLRSTDTKRTALAPSPRKFKFGNTIVASLGTATICFQTASGELLAYDTDEIQLNVPALFGLLLMRVANVDVLVSSMPLRSPTWSEDLQEHGCHLYVKQNGYCQ
jgi:hypothetical protein